MSPRRTGVRGVTRSLPMLGFCLLACLFLASTSSLAQSPEVESEFATFDIEVIEPSGREAVFGPLTVVVAVHGTDSLEVMELKVDGRSRGRLTAPPWRFRVDVGQANREHLFEVVARRAGGEEAKTTLRTPPIQIDEEVAVELQQLYVTATGRGGQRVLDLREEDFRILDEGRPQELVTFARGDVPITATAGSVRPVKTFPLMATSLYMPGGGITTR